MNQYDWYHKNKGLLKKMYNKLLSTINNMSDVLFISDHIKCFKDFVNTIYKEYVLNEFPVNHKLEEDLSDYFEMKYTDIITDIYIDLKIMSNKYCSDIFKNKNCTSDTLINFIQKHIFIDINYESDIEEDSDEY